MKKKMLANLYKVKQTDRWHFLSLSFFHIISSSAFSPFYFPLYYPIFLRIVRDSYVISSQTYILSNKNIHLYISLIFTFHSLTFLFLPWFSYFPVHTKVLQRLFLFLLRRRTRKSRVFFYFKLPKRIPYTPFYFSASIPPIKLVLSFARTLYNIQQRDIAPFLQGNFSYLWAFVHNTSNFTLYTCTLFCILFS